MSNLYNFTIQLILSQLRLIAVWTIVLTAAV